MVGHEVHGVWISNHRGKHEEKTTGKNVTEPGARVRYIPVNGGYLQWGTDGALMN